MVANLYKKDIRDDETYITLYGIFTYDNIITLDHKYKLKIGKRYYYDIPIKKYSHNITDKWKRNVVKGDVFRANEVEVDGKIIKINGQNYNANNIRITFRSEKKIEENEKKVRDIIHNETGAKIIIYPSIKNPQNRQTPDVLMESKIKISNEKWDIKTLGKNVKEYNNSPFFSDIEKKKEQADNFIIDVGKLEDKKSVLIVKLWASELFSNESTNFVNKVMIIGNDRIFRIYKRKKDTLQK